MNTPIIKGDELMLFKGGKSLAYATSHSLSVSGNTSDISSKDHGAFSAVDVVSVSWEASSENLFTTDNFSELFDAMIGRTAITVAFGFASDWDVNGIVNGTATPANWSLDESKTYYTGTAYITSLQANSNTGENATYSVTLSGSGALKKVSA